MRIENDRAPVRLNRLDAYRRALSITNFFLKMLSYVGFILVGVTVKAYFCMFYYIA